MARPFVTVLKDGSFGPEYGNELGAVGYRLTFDRNIPNQPEYLRECLSAGLETYLTADTDSFPKSINWDAVRKNPEDRGQWESQVEETIAEYSKNYSGLCTYICAMNEFNDTGYEGSRMPASVVNRITELWRYHFGDDQRLVAASDVSGDPESLAALDFTHVNLLDIHLWAKAPYDWPDPMSGRLCDTLDRYQARWPGMGFCISEIGFSSTEDGSDEQKQADYVALAMMELVQRADLDMVGLYAMQDWRGMGLLRYDGSKKPSYWSYRLGSQYWTGGSRAVVPGPEPQPERRYQFVEGFKRIDDLYPGVLGEPLENEVPIIQGLATQRTSNGDLTWARIDGQGEVFTFTKRADGERWRWRREDLGL